MGKERTLSFALASRCSNLTVGTNSVKLVGIFSFCAISLRLASQITYMLRMVKLKPGIMDKEWTVISRSVRHLQHSMGGTKYDCSWAELLARLAERRGQLAGGKNYPN